MVKDESGIWQVTLGPIPKGLWSYSFKVDGEYQIDQNNPGVKVSREGSASILDLPGDNVWDTSSQVSAGVVHQHQYTVSSTQPSAGISGRVKKLCVYTPPGYQPQGDVSYPVLYLLHGSGDDQTTWTDFGRLNVMCDNLIAASKIQPMIVVMPDGSPRGNRDQKSFQRESAVFYDEFLHQIVPMVESLYRTKNSSDSRAITGLSMGGGQSLDIGLTHPELFGYVGSMSSGMYSASKVLGRLIADQSRSKYSLFRLIWISCGQDDVRHNVNVDFHEQLERAGIRHTYVETSGGHSWPVWRDDFIRLAPLLFVPRQ